MFEGGGQWEIIKLFVSTLTPISVAIVGYFLNRRLKSIDDAQWQNRKIVEKRLDLFDKISPDLNSIFCFFVWVGYWKDISPKDLIDKKRELDKIVHIYRHLLSPEFYSAYCDFIHLAFRTYSGAGMDALIRSEISCSDGDRREHANYEWKAEYESFFDASRAPERRDFIIAYQKVMDEFRNCIGGS
jgi:hypothetical protein